MVTFWMPYTYGGWSNSQTKTSAEWLDVFDERPAGSLYNKTDEELTHK
jgi:hypothetical protein